MSPYHDHICGSYYLDETVGSATPYRARESTRRRYLPLVSLKAHATIISSVCRTTLSQTFQNPASGRLIPELRYTFPLYDGVSVVGFVCTINDDRVIKGVVKERQEANKIFDDAVSRGETAGLFEQLPDAADVFTTTIGNVPAGANITVDITYLGELRHDAEVDGIRFTLPTSIAPRYGAYPGALAAKPTNATGIPNGISIVVDVEMPLDTNIRSVQSPSHPIAVTLGSVSAAAADEEISLRRASATLALGTAELDKDFVMLVATTNTGNPVAVLETHPTLPSHQALMATLVPKFALPPSRPEIVFLCDRSGSMSGGGKIPNLRSALQIFLKSLPLGVKFNICSFGSHFSYLFPGGSRSYSQASMDQAALHVNTIRADFGGTDIHAPLEDIFKRRYKDMELEVFVLTDGEIWDQTSLFAMVDRHVRESDGAIRVFTLGVGDGVSHSLIQGLARSGNGFSQAVGENEQMNSKVVRMLKASLTPHIKDYTLEIKYDHDADNKDTEDGDFELVEEIKDNKMAVDMSYCENATPLPPTSGMGAISLFDPAANPDADVKEDRFAGVADVPEPKQLQAPFEIPPLYPFNRTSVYILMPDASTSRTPRSVVLRGTCKHGPLELEIPVTVNRTKAETIHQLAARTAIRELEEGRGWIYHAKNSEGHLLKDRHEGRFSDMVEREAVRLGVKYQVGGKWCSFVAVDPHGAAAASAPPPAYQDVTFARSNAQPPPPAPRSRMLLASGRQPMLPSTTGTNSYSHFGGPGSSAQPVAFHAAPSPASPAPRSSSVRSKTSNGAAPPPAQGKMMKKKMNDDSKEEGCSLGALRRRDAEASARPTPPPLTVCEDNDATTRPLQLQMISVQLGGVGGGGRGGSIKSQPVKSASTTLHRGPSGSASTPPPPPPPPPPSAQSDKLDRIVALQTFEGCWRWAVGGLFGHTGLFGKITASELAAVFANYPDVAAESDVMATAAVVAFLRTKMAAREDEWDMMVEKAMAWIDQQKLSVSANALVSAAQGVFVC